MDGLPFAAVEGGVRLTVRVAPKSARNRIEGVVRDAQGAAALKVAVTEAPERGRANDAVIALLAKEWRLPKSAFAVVKGAADRRKSLFVTGDPAQLVKRLEGWMTVVHE
jgi:uncharacterized protein YggU (UPF0235/DUF167 family)